MRLSSRKAARFLVRFVVLGAAAGTLAGYSAVAMRSSRALPAGDVTGSAAEPVQPQVSNKTAKADRLPRLIEATLTAAERPNFTLASAIPTAELERSGAALAGAPQAMPLAEPEQATSEPVTEPEQTAIAAVPLPPAEAQASAPAAAGAAEQPARRHADFRPQGPAAADLGSGRILAGGGDGAARRRPHAAERGRAKHAHAGKVNIDVNSPEVQRLIWAAMPLLDAASRGSEARGPQARARHRP